MLQTVSVISKQHLDLLGEISLKEQKKHLFPLVLALGLLGFMLAAWQLISANYFLLVLGIALMVNVFTFFPLTTFFSKKLVAKNNLNAKLLEHENKNVITYNAEHALVESYLENAKQTEIKLNYLTLTKVTQYKNALFIYLSSTQAFVVLSHEATKGSYDELTDFLKSKLAARYTVLS